MTGKTLSTLLDELRLLVQYSAPEEHRSEAIALAERYQNDRIALSILHTFYSFLPEAEEDWIDTLRLVAEKQGIFLICASSMLSAYLYLVGSEETVFCGPLEEGITDGEILSFYGWNDLTDFQKHCRQEQSLPEYQPVAEDHKRCPVCAVAEGECHIMGCPVEICPWCGGQLIHCNCRFQKTGRAAFTSDSHLDELYEKLSQTGRIPFNPANQSPAPAAVKDAAKTPQERITH